MSCAPKNYSKEFSNYCSARNYLTTSVVTFRGIFNTQFVILSIHSNSKPTEKIVSNRSLELAGRFVCLLSPQGKQNDCVCDY